MPYANIGDTKIYYEIYGSEYELLEDGIRQKPTIVAIHGGPGVDHNYYMVPFLAEAAKFAQVIFIDQRGNGRSIDNNPENWNLEQWATDVYHFCDTLSLEKPFIFGVSMGGWVTQLYASLYPNQAGGIILNDTEAFLDFESILNAFEAKGGKQIREVAYRYFYQPSTDSMQEFFEKCIPLCSNNPIPQKWLKRTILTPEVNSYTKEQGMLNFNLTDKIKNIKIPVLYLTNTNNALHLYKSAKKTAAAMINTKVNFVAFENCGLVGIDAKKEGLNQIESFVKKI